MAGRHRKESGSTAFMVLCSLGIGAVIAGVVAVFQVVPASNELPGQAPATSVSAPTETWEPLAPAPTPSLKAPENGNRGDVQSPTSSPNKVSRPSAQPHDQQSCTGN